jgi:RNA polymerase-binding transcription factor DksA
VIVQVEELEARVAELEEELEETRQNLETASSIGQQMVERLQQIEEENEELRVGNMAPDAIHESEIVRRWCACAARIVGD